MNASEYLDGKVIAQLTRIPLRARSLARGLYRGLHRATHRGQNIEYREHRAYSPGDDLRRIDWKAMARTDRLYVKEYEEDANINVLFIIDESLSMTETGGGKQNRLHYGRSLLVTLACLMLMQGDRVAAVRFGESIEWLLKPTGSMEGVGRLGHALTEFGKGHKSDLTTIQELKLPFRDQNSLVFFISDFLTSGPDLLDTLKALRAKKSEVILFHLLSETEALFNLKGEFRFIEPESNRSLELNSAAVKKTYLDALTRFSAELKANAHQLGMAYEQMVTSQSYAESLHRFLHKYQA